MKRHNKEITSLRLSPELKREIDALRKAHPIVFNNRTHLIEVALWELIESFQKPKSLTITHRHPGFTTLKDFKPTLKDAGKA